MKCKLSARPVLPFSLNLTPKAHKLVTNGNFSSYFCHPMKSRNTAVSPQIMEKNENLFYLKFFQICGVRFGSLCDEDMTNSFALNEHIKKATCKSVQGRTKMSKKLRRIVKGLSLIGLESFYQRNSIHTQLHFEIIEFCEYICKFHL